jgi:hypothetical protein
MGPGAAGAWPWPLRPITGGAIGAWVFSLGVAAGHSLAEGDCRRVRPAAKAELAFVVLQTIALIRHGGDIDWSSGVAIAYVVMLVSMAVVGVATLVLARGGAPSDDIDLRSPRPATRPLRTSEV